MIDSSALGRVEGKWEENTNEILSYEKVAIESKIEDDFRKRQQSYCPISAHPLSLDSLVLNKELQWKINYWAKKNYGSFEKAAAAVSASVKETHGQGCLHTVRSSSSVDSLDSLAPEQFICPLSRAVMDDPVTSKDGSATFERSQILRWLDSAISTSCPITDQALRREDLVRDDELANAIQEWKNRLKLVD